MDENKFTYKGKNIKARIVHDSNCRGCIFEKACDCYASDDIPACAPMGRTDNENVIFVEE